MIEIQEGLLKEDRTFLVNGVEYHNSRLYAKNNYHFYDIDGFGWEMHSALTSFNYAEAKILANQFLHIKSITLNNTPEQKSLEGLTFVITGKLQHFKNRDAIKEMIESLGGRVAGSVSKNTNYLINNDSASTSSKNRTAQSLGVPILTENDFIETFGINTWQNKKNFIKLYCKD